MYSVTNFKKTITVNRVKDSFVITNLASGQKVVVSSSEYRSNLFKYESEFYRKFKSYFDNVEYMILSHEAANFVTSLILFNRDDN